MYSTYAFEDISVALSHPSVGSITAAGEGLGSITVARATDTSAHDLASDGSVMTSKIKAKNGTVTFAVQQTSAVAKRLRKLNAYLETAPSSEWTRAVCTISSPVMGVKHSCTGVSPQKAPDGTYQQAGQQISFAYLCQSITGL